jgi:hypothetical protein
VYFTKSFTMHPPYPAFFMTVRREIVQSRCETGMRRREAPRRT